MARIAALLFALSCALWSFGAGAAQKPLPGLYAARVVVTGTGETNRRIGFRLCLDQVLVRVSGDHRILARPQMAGLRDIAGSFVAEYSYRDRLEGIPVHDEQGTHDRPHDLTCIYKPDTIDALLESLGARPWTARRPVLAVLLATRNGEKAFMLTADGAEGPYMRDSFQAAAAPLAIRIAFPSNAQVAHTGLTAGSIGAADGSMLERIAKAAGADRALAGSIVWNDKDLGWVADWRLDDAGTTYRWQVRGVSFDEAFRVAIRGAAQILSGNGQP